MFRDTRISNGVGLGINIIVEPLYSNLDRSLIKFRDTRISNGLSLRIIV